MNWQLKPLKAPTILLWGGWVILKKNTMQANMCKKKIPAQDHRPNKIHARTVGWKKNSVGLGLAQLFLPADRKKGRLGNHNADGSGNFIWKSSPVYCAYCAYGLARNALRHIGFVCGCVNH